MIPASIHRLLGDEARLRLLRVLAADRFNVSELTGILGLAQSGVSRHLGLLREAGLVEEARDGSFTFYRLASGATAPHDPLWQLLDAEFDSMADDRAVRADLARLHEVLRQRKEQFDQHRPDGDEAGQLVPGRSWAAWARALAHLMPPLVVADLGCGEGYLTIEAAGFARRVIAVDRSAAVLARARDLAERRKVRNIVWKRGTLEQLPIAGSTIDLALLSQALHHAADPARALDEAARILVEGGRVLILDLKTHDQAWVRDRLGDRWLGFEERQLARLLSAAGFVQVRTSVGARRAGGPFTVVVASAVRPAASSPIRRASRRRPRKDPTHE